MVAPGFPLTWLPAMHDPGRNGRVPSGIRPFLSSGHCDWRYSAGAGSQMDVGSASSFR
jgi:hypothetical protein